MIDIPHEKFDFCSRDKSKVGQPAWYQDEDGYVCLRCPNCCIPSFLATHSVTDDGIVSPSIWCQCPKGIRDQLQNDDWHVFGRLIGWTKENNDRRQT